MTPQESLSLFASRIEGPSRGLAIAHASRNFQLAALNYRQLFKGHLMCGLISWRLQKDPTEFLCNAVSVVAEGIATLRELSPTSIVEENLPIGKALLLAYLTGRSFGAVATVSGEGPPDSQLDLLLTTSSPTNTKQTELIGDLRKAKRTLLAAETYQNYFNILAAEGDSEKLEELTKQGELLFTKRARDSFFSGGDQTEGGGPDNNLVVDFRLAVALKRVGKHSSSLHAWEW